MLRGFYHGIQIAMKLNKYDKAAEYAEKLKECKRSGMTTVTEEEVNKLIQEVKNHNEKHHWLIEYVQRRLMKLSDKSTL